MHAFPRQDVDGTGERCRHRRHEHREAAVVEFLDPDDLAEAAGAVERRVGAVARLGRSFGIAEEHARLDHRDSARPGERVADHFAITFFKNVQRQLRAREQQRPGKREQRHPRRLAIAHVNNRADRRRR
jgi:hypothetical protein